MKYAVIKISGRQYKVKEKEELFLSKITEKEAVTQTLLFVDGDKVKIGKPYLSSNKVSLKVIESLLKGKKVKILKYKAKSRYRKRIGFRPLLTKVVVEKIS